MHGVELQYLFFLQKLDVAGWSILPLRLVFRTKISSVDCPIPWPSTSPEHCLGYLRNRLLWSCGLNVLESWWSIRVLGQWCLSLALPCPTDRNRIWFPFKALLLRRQRKCYASQTCNSALASCFSVASQSELPLQDVTRRLKLNVETSFFSVCNLS